MFFTKCLVVALSLSMFWYITVKNIEMYLNGNNYKWDNATINVSRSKMFDMYLKKFNKSYSDGEYQIRLSYFRDSMIEISVLNGVTGAKHGWTRFTDMSKKEFSKLMLKSGSVSHCQPTYMACVPNINKTIIPNDIPDKVDWRTKGAIGPVIDQLMCSCCWAVSIVGNMEAMAVKRGFGYQQLSIQELIDCSKYNNGCLGGSMAALKYLCYKKLALTTEEQYPLKLVNDDCKSSLYQGIRRIKEYTVQCNMREDDILRIIANYGPVVVVVNSGPWHNYNEGIIQRACYRGPHGSPFDHMVQIVGYDLTNDVPYYIVKNSWGSRFGEDGYVRLATNRNMCGLADEVAHFDVY